MLQKAKRIVIKIGSSLITHEHDGCVREDWLRALAEDLHALKSQGKEIIIVTSGAVALGRIKLGLAPKAQMQLEQRQAAAACGQIELFSAWRDALGRHDLNVAQLLLTADDSIDRRRYLNARNTLETLLALSAIPVINENDTVATEELRFGDNDRLAARVAQMAGADLLVLMSDVDGLYDSDPNTNSKAVLIEEVPEITITIESMADGTFSNVGTGGMVTKLAAAKIATAAGCHMLIARGTEAHPLSALQKGGKCTHFVAKGNPLSARKNWIAGSMHPSGSITVDDGAAAALKSGKSLLPAGVKAVDGKFERGDTVSIRDMSGRNLGKGLSAYSSEDAARIIGRKSQDVETILGFKGRAALIERDDMVLE